MSAIFQLFFTEFHIFEPMFRKIICWFFAGFFLTSSVVLPLGDISLIRDIPAMYRNYTQVTSDEEVGAIDFIGDYLLHGKDLFGHNEHDKVPAKGCDIQFQHQASPTNVIFNRIQLTLFSAPVSVLIHPTYQSITYHSDYRKKLFRPPLS